MEMEFFVPPAEAARWYEYWKESGATGTSASACAPTTCACASTMPTS